MNFGLAVVNLFNRQNEKHQPQHHDSESFDPDPQIRSVRLLGTTHGMSEKSSMNSCAVEKTAHNVLTRYGIDQEAIRENVKTSLNLNR